MAVLGSSGNSGKDATAVEDSFWGSRAGALRGIMAMLPWTPWSVRLRPGQDVRGRRAVSHVGA